VRALQAAIVLAGAILACIPAARAETLVVATSTGTVNIASNFSGTDITVFGSIERDRATVSRASEYQIAVQVFGPGETVVTRRKQRGFGVWVNRDSRTYVDVPSFYAALTTGTIDQIGPPETLRRFQVGLEHLILPERSTGSPDDPAPGDPDFRAGFLRLKLHAGLYRELPGAVTFLSPTLFRATIPLPANVPVGQFRIQVGLFQEGVSLAQHTSAVVVSKTGFEQFMFDLAFTRPLLYGLGTVVLALLTGWFAGIIFRRD